MEPRRAYKTDLTDAQWEQIEPLVSVGHQPEHHRRKHTLREILNTLLYQLRTGCAWEHLPHDLPPKGTVYDYFHLWTHNGTFARIHTVLREQVREQAGREAQPSAAIVDTQSVKTTEKGGRPARSATMGAST
jgi:putative transposase